MPEFQTPDGVTLYYEDTGAGVPILFIHEFGGDYRSWHRQIPVLSNSYRCITYSARGFLPSGVPADRSQYGQAFSTRDALAVVDHLGLDQAHVVGTSMGSFTSLDFALNHPDRVRSVTLIGNSSGPRDAEEQVNYRETWVGHEIRLREADGGDGAVAVLEADPAYQSFQQDDPEGWAIYASNLRGQSAEGAVHVLSTLHWDRRSLFDEQDRLRALDKPVLLATGDDDYYLVGETNALLSEILPNATWRQLPGIGHLVNIERAEAFNALFQEFLDGQA